MKNILNNWVIRPNCHELRVWYIYSATGGGAHEQDDTILRGK